MNDNIISECEIFFKKNENLRYITFKDLKIKDSCDSKYLTTQYIQENCKINLTKINKASQGKIYPLKFNCSDIFSLLDGEASTDKVKVSIDIETGDILIKNGHHRLCWFKILAENNIIDKYMNIESVEFYHYEKKIKGINSWILKYNLSGYIPYIEIIQKDNYKTFYKFNFTYYEDKEKLFEAFIIKKYQLNNNLLSHLQIPANNQ